MNEKIKKDVEQQEKEENTQSEDKRSEDQLSFDERMQDLSVKEKEGIIKWRGIFSIFMRRFLSIQYRVIRTLILLQGCG